MQSVFDKVADFDDLVRALRRRYQMWVGDDLAQLKGFFAGFCSAKPSVDHRRLLAFEEFVLKQVRAGDDDAKNWTTALRRSAPNVHSEIPLFFEWYEQFSGMRSSEVVRIELSDAERAHFLERDTLQFRSQNRDSPESMSLWRSDYWGPMVRFHDGSGRTCFELGVTSIEYGHELIAKYRGAQAST